MTARRPVTVEAVPAGNAAMLVIGMWSLAVSGEELASLVDEGQAALAVLGRAGSGASAGADDGRRRGERG